MALADLITSRKMEKIMRTKIMLVSFALALVPVTISAYDTDTHAWIMYQAFRKSVLNSDNPTASGLMPIRERLGLDRLDDVNPFRIPIDLPLQIIGQTDAYLDLQPGASPYNTSPNPYRPAMPYEQSQFAVSQFPPGPGVINEFLTPLRIESLLMRGAVREDDLYPSEYDGLAPDTDPYGDVRRVAWHFWNPIADTPLVLPANFSCNVVFGAACKKAVDAAIGLIDSFSPTFNPDSSRRNHFSWLDARESFWRALTFKTAVPSASNYANTQATDAAIRKNYWNTTFVSLGHVAHLLEDVAQPQHTRNDRHNPKPIQPIGTDLARRTMEAYANYRVTGNTNSLAPGEQPTFRAFFNGPAEQRLLSLPPVGNYPIVQFSTPVKFFSTKVEDTVLANRRGLADFSNRGFFSEGTINGDGFASPPPALTDPAYTITDAALYQVPLYGQFYGRKLMWTVPDAVAPGYVDTCAVNGKVPAKTVSGFVDFATQSTGLVAVSGTLSLDDYKCQQDMLLPRAIAYSAGLINHFFRGELEITAPVQRVLGAVDQGIPHTVDAAGYPRRNDNNQILGFNKIRLKLRNITPDIAESGSGNTYAQTRGGSDSNSLSFG
jgi:hypothetical protein